MPGSDAATSSTTRSNGRKRPSQSRVIPAIPLALSNPRQSKSQPKAETDARAGATPTTPATPAIDAAKDGDLGQALAVASPTIGGSEQVTASSAIEQTEESVPNGVKSSTADTPVSRGSVPTSISSGATPERAAAAEPQTLSTPSPPPASSEPLLVSPSSARKSTDKHDMRPLRTQLPPPFVPLADRQTPQSATSSARPHSQPYFPRRVHHPSTNSIIFGGHDSSSSSPVPPPSDDSSLHPSQWPPLGASGASQPPSFTPSSHAHHASEPYGQRTYNPPSSVLWHMRQGFQPPMYPPPQFQHHEHTPFRYPPREVFTPAEERQPDGEYSRSRSLSQASGAAPRTGEELQLPTGADTVDSMKPPFREPRAPFHPAPLQLRHNYKQYGPPTPQHAQPEMISQLDDAEALRAHVRSQFGNPLLADCHLQIVENETSTRQYFDGHKIILSRSPTLHDLIQSSDPPAFSALKTQVHVPLRTHCVSIKPLMDCIQYLYGGTLAPLDQLRQAPFVSDVPSTNEERMRSALQYLATAAWLRLPTVAARGMGAALGFLHWDTMSAVLGFALDGGLGPSFTVEDGSEISCSSSDDSLGRTDGIGLPTHDPYATDLLHRVIDFTVHMFPPNFYLDASSPQLASCPRLPPLPPTHESRPSRSDPRLSQIRFGELAVEDHGRPSLVTTTISSILLSLPFPLLKCILEHNGMVFQLGADTVASIMRQVVAEREVRRKRILQARTAGQTADGAELLLVQNLYFEERVEASAHHRAGFRLARRRRGVDTPPSSGATSERRE